ncbi:S41 family peptidase [Chitinimonas naiadis]
MQTTLGLALLAFAALWPAGAQAAETAALPAAVRYDVGQLQQDFLAMQTMISRTHPDVRHSVSHEALTQAYRRVAVQLQKPMTRDEAWRVLATLNPVFADAHLAITQPDWRGQVLAHLKAGGGLFPYEVHVDPTGEVYIRAELGGKPTPLAGARIDTINGRKAGDVVAAILDRTHGDTLAFRANIASRRWAYFYWKRYDAPERYTLTLHQGDRPQTLQLAAGTQTPAQIATDNDFDRQFQFALLPDNTALLTINSFYWEDKARYFAFTERAFTAIRDAKVSKLIIDIRANGGGDDDLWKKGLLRYIADKPYKGGSGYFKKVLAGRQSGTEQVGDVIAGTIQTWEGLEPEGPLHFHGKTYVLVGDNTYSSAILFSNVVQDYDFGKVVGTGGYARTLQSGGVQSQALPNTGLEIGAPRFLLIRPSGAAKPELLTPDISLPDNPYVGDELVQTLLKRISAQP